MTAGDRGPAGLASPPPAFLARAKLPLTSFAAGETFVRIHWSRNHPVFFSPGPGQPPVGRFDSGRGRFGALYAAESFEGAFVETVLRNPARRLVSSGEIEGRSVAVLAPSRGIRLVAMHGPGLQMLGVDNAITTGSYKPCADWADALFDHPARPDGIAYVSRHDPEQLCVAVFERDDLSFSLASDSVPLSALHGNVARVLRRYGKGVVG